MLTSDLRDQIEVLRIRIIKAKRLEAAGEPVPPGLIPSDSDLRDLLTAWRKARIEAPASSTTSRATGSEAAKKISSPDFDLKAFFGAK